MLQQLYSLRMRSSRGDCHISGAERLLCVDRLEETAADMLHRALSHPRGMAEQIYLSVQPVAAEQVRICNLLPLSTFSVADWLQGRQCAVDLLEKLGLKRSIVEQAVAQLAAGPAPQGEVMRGAMLVDAVTGQRLESDPARGVRVSRMDVASAARKPLLALLDELGLGQQRVVEALVLASKVALYPQVIAELCWSDDPDYQTGYVASAQNGYQRITCLKKRGDRIGGRIFFIRPTSNLESLIERLQYEPVLFRAPESKGV